jgi:ABC-2 type transport system ATP-binding protein
MLLLESICKSYGDGGLAVSDLSLSLPTGCIAALLGHNGAGKSTTLRIAAGMLSPTSGTVSINGVRLDCSGTHDDSALRRQIGYLPEETHLLDYLTPAEQLWFVGQMYGVTNTDELSHRTGLACARFAIEGPDTKLIRELSAGQRRRVALASALLMEPPILLLDEPTNFLDPIGVKILKDHLLQLRAHGAVVLLATHRLDVAEQLADHIVIIDHGRVLFSDSIEQLRARFPEPGHRASLETLYARLVGN